MHMSVSFWAQDKLKLTLIKQAVICDKKVQFYL